MLTDPVADMLTRIRNANKALHDRTEMPTSRLKEEIARILKEEGYIRDYSVIEDEKPYKTLVIELKYSRSRERGADRSEARVEAGPPDLRQEGSAAARARRHGHRDPLDVPRRDHESHRGARRARRRGHLFRLVANRPGSKP